MKQKMDCLEKLPFIYPQKIEKLMHWENLWWEFNGYYTNYNMLPDLTKRDL